MIKFLPWLAIYFFIMSGFFGSILCLSLLVAEMFIEKHKDDLMRIVYIIGLVLSLCIGAELYNTDIRFNGLLSSFLYFVLFSATMIIILFLDFKGN